ncbi:MAG TPA: rhodanese-like domain-containing protein [Euzebyales bacterium]|nr:rhodanese-like domain-containing protein [Euzebyales bacterium]
MTAIDGADVARLLAGPAPVVVIHAGGPGAFREAHIPGSVAFASFPDAVRMLRPDDRIVVYGTRRACPRAQDLAVRLRHALSSTVWWYVGGLDDWRSAGRQIEGRSV